MKNHESYDERTPLSGCDTQNPPPGYEVVRDGKSLWKKCQEYWVKAREVLNPLGFEKELQRHSAIKVIKRKLGRTSEHICYNEGILKLRGWCEIEGSTKEDRKWGICSTSCMLYEYYTGTVIQAPIYHEMDLRVLKCQDSLEFAFKYESRGFFNDALICGKPIYSPQNFWTFEKIRKFGKPNEFKSRGSKNVEITRVGGMKAFIGNKK